MKTKFHTIFSSLGLLIVLSACNGSAGENGISATECPGRPSDSQLESTMKPGFHSNSSSPKILGVQREECTEYNIYYAWNNAGYHTKLVYLDNGRWIIVGGNQSGRGFQFVN